MNTLIVGISWVMKINKILSSLNPANHLIPKKAPVVTKTGAFPILMDEDEWRG